MPYILESELYLQASMDKQYTYETLKKASRKDIDKGYFDEYWRIVRSKEILLEGYEDHHIILQAYQKDGSCNIDIHSIENLCRLSYKNHFLAHWYLWKAIRDTKTALAAKLLHGLNRKLSRISDVDITAEEYAKLKEACWSDPKERKAHSCRLKKYFKEHPEAVRNHTKRIKEYFDNPENRKAHSKTISEYHKNHPEFALTHSETMKNRFKDNPDLIEEHKTKLREYYKNPDNRTAVSESLKNFNKKNPNFRKENSERIKKKWEDPRYRAELTLIKSTPIICIFTGTGFVSLREAERCLDTDSTKFKNQINGKRIVDWNGYFFRYANKVESKKIKATYLNNKGIISNEDTI